MDTVKAVFYIPQPYLATIEIGNTVTVSTEGTERVTGTITHIAEQAAGYQPYALITEMRTAIQIPF